MCDLDYVTFLEIKEIVWITLWDFKIFPTTILRVLEDLERFRYIVTSVPLVQHFLNDSSLQDTLTRQIK